MTKKLLILLGVSTVAGIAMNLIENYHLSTFFMAVYFYTSAVFLHGLLLEALFVAEQARFSAQTHKLMEKYVSKLEAFERYHQDLEAISDDKRCGYDCDYLRERTISANNKFLNEVTKMRNGE